MERIPIFPGSKCTLSAPVADAIVVVVSGLGVPALLFGASRLFGW